MGDLSLFNKLLLHRPRRAAEKIAERLHSDSPLELQGAIGSIISELPDLEKYHIRSAGIYPGLKRALSMLNVVDAPSQRIDIGVGLIPYYIVESPDNQCDELNKLASLEIYALDLQSVRGLNKEHLMAILHEEFKKFPGGRQYIVDVAEILNNIIDTDLANLEWLETGNLAQLNTLFEKKTNIEYALRPIWNEKKQLESRFAAESGFPERQEFYAHPLSNYLVQLAGAGVSLGDVLSAFDCGKKHTNNFIYCGIDGRNYWISVYGPVLGAIVFDCLSGVRSAGKNASRKEEKMKKIGENANDGISTKDRLKELYDCAASVAHLEQNDSATSPIYRAINRMAHVIEEGAKEVNSVQNLFDIRMTYLSALRNQKIPLKEIARQYKAMDTYSCINKAML